MRPFRRGFARFSDRRPAAVLILVIACVAGVRAESRGSGRETLDQPERIEGAAILSLADAAMAGRPVPSDFWIEWHADFLKAQQGTFVPFVLTVDGPSLPRSAALLYLRAVPRGTSARRGASKDNRADLRKETREESQAGRDAQARRGKQRANAEPQYPVDVIFPIEFAPEGGLPLRVTRGFLIPPGEYDLYVVLRERSDPAASAQPAPRATVATVPLSVPDFWTRDLAVSSVILADRLTLVEMPPSPEQLLERPYVIGVNDVHPAPGARFRKDEELICVFLVYNPKVGPDRNFDIEVEYHFFRKAGPSPGAEGAPGLAPAEHPPERPGERYVNHTEPQRFTAATMGPQFDPTAGQPIMAGQGVPLAGFQEGDYRLLIKVTDLLAGSTLTRDVDFTVGS